MGEAIPRQHPAVVLRSHFNQLRALLAVALIAVAGLTVAVVILATDDEAGSGSATVSAPAPSGTTRYDGGPDEGTRGVLPAQQPNVNAQPGVRYDGGPDEGTRGVLPAQQPNVDPRPGVRYDGGPEEGSAGNVSPKPQAQTGSRSDGASDKLLQNQARSEN
jgi:hypothetical protein